jgi:hypothetical protein
MIDAASIAHLRTPAALAADAASTDATYGDHCYVCGHPDPAITMTLRHSVDPLTSTDESVCLGCCPNIVQAA